MQGTQVILYNEGATQPQQDEAGYILSALCDVYPGYPWAVRVYEGGFFIRHLGYPPGWGMNCKTPEFGYSASALKRTVVMRAGEWLERARLKRSRNLYEDEPGWVEGIPAHQQPAAEKPGVIAQAVFAARRVESQVRPEVARAVKEIHDG